MIEEILPNLYKIEVPLPQSPLQAINSYVIKAQGQSLIIDTGQNREECMSVMSSGLNELDVDLKRADFFITHLHADHLGLVLRLATDMSTVYFNQKETYIVNAESSKQEERYRKLNAVYLANGFPEDELQRAIKNHPGRKYSPRGHLDFHISKEGDTIRIGDYLFKCIETPGHSPGHMCLYEANKKILVAGDHILSDITPNITFWQEMKSSLKQYLASLEKVYTLDVNLTLPGHRSILDNHRMRVRELQEHHQNRLNEVLSALEDGGKTAFQVAPYVTWDIDCDSWETFPPPQKWFAFGETLAHLEYLEEKGKIRKEMQGRKVVFLLK